MWNDFVATAIRSGDYYMFEDEDEDDDKVETAEESADSLSVGKDAKEGDQSPTPFQVRLINFNYIFDWCFRP